MIQRPLPKGIGRCLILFKSFCDFLKQHAELRLLLRRQRTEQLLLGDLFFAQGALDAAAVPQKTPEQAFCCDMLFPFIAGFSFYFSGAGRCIFSLPELFKMLLPIFAAHMTCRTMSAASRADILCLYFHTMDLLRRFVRFWPCRPRSARRR